MALSLVYEWGMEKAYKILDVKPQVWRLLGKRLLYVHTDT